MRLIQPTVLLLLVAIHCESCPVFNDEEPKWEKELLECASVNCPTEKKACFRDSKCRNAFHCMSRHCPGKNMVKECFDICRDIYLAVKLTECAAEKNCIPDLTCPGEGTKGLEVPLIWPNLVKQLIANDWWAVLTEDPYENGAFNNPCSKYTFSAECVNEEDNVLLHLSTCFGNSRTGECRTEHQDFFWNGTQRGSSGIIDLALTNEDYLVPTNPVDTNKLTLYVHDLKEGAYASVSFCVKTEINSMELSGRMIISPSRTIESLKRNIDNATLTKLGRATSKFSGTHGHPMNNERYCTN